MRNNWQLFLGALILVWGLVLLLGVVFDIDTGALCFPIALIGIGVFVLLRPRFIAPGTNVEMRLFGDVRRRGAWEVADEEFWTGIGDVRLDLSETDIPPGETRYRALGFIGDIRLIVPEDVGVSIDSVSFLTEARVFDWKRQSFFVPVHYATENYETTERKIHVEMSYFIGEIKVRSTPTKSQ